MSLKLIIGGQFYNSGGGGGGTIPSTTNLLQGDGAGNAASSGIAASNVMLKSVYDPANISAQLAGRTVSNTFLAAQLVSLSSLGLTATPALTLINPTAAAAGAQQVSPGLVLEGQGWKTDATAASQAVTYRMHVLPVQGAANPSGELHFESSINGAAYVQHLSIASSGTSSFGGSIVIAAGSSVTWSARGGIAFPSSGVLQFFTNGFASNVDLVCAASATLQLGQNAAGVTNQMITAANRITSDGVGANLTIAPGNGRGGAGGSLILSTYTTAGAGVAGTLTTRLTLDTSGVLTFADAVNMAFNATTGTQIGTASTQKIGFWGGTPRVQPVSDVTVGVSSAGGGTPVLDDTEFDGGLGTAGYTIGGLVRVLKGVGILAS